ncbi:MAG: beta-lactamase family protein [Planctomycetales bacterium]|nr:beta-lactamase family protein [Planctomycetales bacterium]
MPTIAPSRAVDFAEVTLLAEAALAGQHVSQPLEGFEVLIAHHGDVIYQQAFGDWQLDRLAEIDSASKTLSAALVMSVADEGAGGFRLDSHLADYLEEYDVPEYDQITVRQAFSHTSGFGGIDVLSPILANRFIDLREAARRIQQRPLTHGPPGTVFAYGGSSMQAAAAALEVAAGGRFVDLLAERITEPLGMTSTQFVKASENNPRVAGGAVSTGRDYLALLDMFLQGGVVRDSGQRVLSEASVRELLTQQTNDSHEIAYSPVDNHRYGIGVWVDQLDQAGPAVPALAAGAGGFHGWIDPANDLAMVVSIDTSEFSDVALLASMWHRAVLEAVVWDAPAADFQRDGQVDGADLAIWERWFGASAEQSWYRGDATGDGATAGDDFLRWQNGWTAKSDAPLTSSVPEPCSAGLWGTAILAQRMRRRLSHRRERRILRK